MRFEGTRIIAAPVGAVWYALRNPDALEVVIPHCARIERQPGYRPESDSDFTLSFELAIPQDDGQPGAIIGWLEVDRQRPLHHLSLTLTLNDALVFMYVEGSVDLTAREHGQQTEVHYTVEAKVPGMRGVGWSAQVHTHAQQVIGTMLDELSLLIEHSVTTTVPQHAQANGIAPVHVTSPQVLLETQRGSVVLLPITEVPAPTQAMLRRVQRAKLRRNERQQRTIASAVTLSAVAVLSGAYALWAWQRRHA